MLRGIRRRNASRICARDHGLRDVRVHRGRGIGKELMNAIVTHPELQVLRRWHLVTRDAHALYAQFGFAPLETPQRHMGRVRMSPYAMP
ncbi:MAG TPA: GNAT family N-acetyltransferase [Thermoanaerobaculia bacterium]|nr:GNAT family N-acetyltransferase [Thermoanaerobaculia bacterium]